MDDYLERAMKAVELALEARPGDHFSVATGPVRERSGNECSYRMVLVSQLKETKSMLRRRNEVPVLEPGHKPVHRELFRHIEALVSKEWWSVSDSECLVIVKRQEHFLEALLAVRWWTMVVAVEAGENLSFPGDTFINMFKESGNDEVSQALVSRHFPSYGFEMWWRETISSRFSFQNEILIGSLEAIRNADFLGFSILGNCSNVDEAELPFIEKEILLDLTQDVLGVSPTGSWVIKTKYEEVECALKRVISCDRDRPPAIACVSQYPHVVELMHYWRKDDAFFLMMELMEGDLTDLLSRHRRASESVISVPLAVDIMLQTAKGMLFLHDMGITYPHLSCSNVLFKQIRPTGLQPDESPEYTIKLGAGGSYCTKVGDDFSSLRKTQDVYRFGLFCLELWTGSEDPMDQIDADTRADIPETLPPILKFCVASCFEGDLRLGFGHVVTLLLLAQYQVLKSKDLREAFLSFGRKDPRESAAQHSRQGCASPSTSGADFEKLYPIHQLYPNPVSDSGSGLPVTLIFFHGFAKSPDEWKSTWMTRNREHVWPEAWLPKDLPGNRVRILALSYDIIDAPGDIQNVVEAAIGKEFNVLRRLVLSSEWNLADPGAKFLLIGHSFGGLVIKSLIVEAHQQAHVRMEDQQLAKKCLNFLENLGGIVLYGVPDSASPDEHFEQYINNLNQTGLLQRSSLMQALMKNTKFFNDKMLILSAQFEENVPENVKILCFIEGKGMRKIRSEKQLVVSEASAKAQLKKADFTVLEKDNHFEVCRPVSRDHISYKILVEHILKVIPGTDSLDSGAEVGRDLPSRDTPSDARNQQANAEPARLMDVSREISEPSDKMIIPAIFNSISGFIDSMTNRLQALPHMRDLKEAFQAISNLQGLLSEQRQEPWATKEVSGLQDVLLNDLMFFSRRLATDWKRLRLLFEPSTFAKTLRQTFKEILDSCKKLQVPSMGDILEQLGKVILDLSDEGGLSSELNKAESEVKKQFSDFLRENRRQNYVTPVRVWLANQLRTDFYTIGHELEEIKEHGGSFIEDLIVYVTELEEKNSTLSELVLSDASYEGESSEFEEAQFLQPLDVVARDAVLALDNKRMARVLHGYANLTKCTTVSGGKFEVYKAGAIAEAIRLAKPDYACAYNMYAMRLLEALTSPRGGAATGSERDCICIEVADHMEVLIGLMKGRNCGTRTRLLAARTVVNVLVNQSVWHSVRSQFDIVSALVAMSDMGPKNWKLESDGRLVNQADEVCLLGLARLSEYPNYGVHVRIGSSWDLTQSIATVLMKLIREGLMNHGEENLAKDSLVALDTEVLVGNIRPGMEVFSHVHKHMSELMAAGAFYSHSSIPGRLAIISIMTKLCGFNQEYITEDYFLYIFSNVQDCFLCVELTRKFKPNPLDLEDRVKLLGRLVKLLSFCVTHGGKNTAQSFFSKNAGARETLEKLLFEEDWGVLNESVPEIIDILDVFSSQTTTVVGRVVMLVKMFYKYTTSARRSVASRIPKCVMEQRDKNDVLAEMQHAGVTDVLMELLKQEDVHHQQDVHYQEDALVALYILQSQSHVVIPISQLPAQIILGFLSSGTRPQVKEAAVAFLDLMVERNAVGVMKFIEIPGALEPALVALKDYFFKNENATSQRNAASALLRIAIEAGDNRVHLGILTALGGYLIDSESKCQDGKFKELLTTMLSLIWTTEKRSDQEAVAEEGGHIFLLLSLREKLSREAAAQSLLRLVEDNENTRSTVLQAGFVTVAMDVIVDQNFASGDIALALASISATSEGMDQIIYASKKGVAALLFLLEHCRTLEGKGAASVVIARLHPRLASEHNNLKQKVLSGAACRHLSRYLRLEDKSHVKMFLKALAAFATENYGRCMIHENRCPACLIKYLKNTQFDNEVQGLILKILAEMSCIFTVERPYWTSFNLKFLNLLLEEKISELLVILPQSEEFNKGTENMKDLLILVRNFSITGQAAVTQLSQHGAVDVLLRIIRLHEHEPLVSVVTALAVRTLEKLVDEPSGKLAFMRGNGIQSLVAILNPRLTRNTFDDMSSTTIILSSVAKDPVTRKLACETIVSCDKDVFLYLNCILYKGETSRIRWQAAVLMRLLATYGPTSRVCSAMIRSGSLNALNQLRDVEHCEEMANDVLTYVTGKSKECKIIINSWKHDTDRSWSDLDSTSGLIPTLVAGLFPTDGCMKNTFIQ